ncbi:ubiquitin-associated protein 2 isoform 6 [Mus musculus]|uniref:ubiquitin-associated protein 2 isoform 6 n=1 Tax=Mus musculus TaxID=10090 RepID=UPI0023F71A18|nr:ubiquitin-associated protein 2 isoform 6 [Mus musculus]
MMTSVSNDRCRGAREKPQMPTAHAAQSQKQVVQATAEQMRLAQVIFDKNDSDFEAKVKQLMEVTGKNQDECIVALHDCNGDVNKAINILLEGNSDTVSITHWSSSSVRLHFQFDCGWELCCRGWAGCIFEGVFWETSLGSFTL